MKVKVLKRFAIDGRLFEPGLELDLPEGIALRKISQGELQKVMEKPKPEPKPEPKPQEKEQQKEEKQLKIKKEDKRLKLDKEDK